MKVLNNGILLVSIKDISDLNLQGEGERLTVELLMTYQVVSEVVARCMAVMAPPAVDLIVPESQKTDISAL